MLKKCWTPQNNVKRAWAKDEKMLNLNSPPPPSNNNVKRACANAEEMLNLNLPSPPSTMWSGLEKMLRKCLTPHNNIEGRRGGGRCKENQCWNCRQKSELLYLPLSMNFLFLYSLCYSELHQRQQSPSVGENRRDCRNCFSFAKKPAVYVQCDGWYLLSFVENIRDSKDYTVVLFISQRGDILEHDVLRSVVCWSVSKDKFCGVTRPLSG